jgi:hypothetical protein
MWVEVRSAFRANGRIYHVGDVVDLPDAFVAELMFSRRVRPASAPVKTPRRATRKKTTQNEKPSASAEGKED